MLRVAANLVEEAAGHGAGQLIPCSQARTVLTETPRNFAKTAWLAWSSSRVRFTSSGP